MKCVSTNGIEPEMLASAAEVIRAVARAHWRVVQSAMARDDFESGTDDSGQDYGELDRGELIGDGGI